MFLFVAYPYYSKKFYHRKLLAAWHYYSSPTSEVHCRSCLQWQETSPPDQHTAHRNFYASRRPNMAGHTSWVLCNLLAGLCGGPKVQHMASVVTATCCVTQMFRVLFSRCTERVLWSVTMCSALCFCVFVGRVCHLTSTGVLNSLAPLLTVCLLVGFVTWLPLECYTHSSLPPPPLTVCLLVGFVTWPTWRVPHSLPPTIDCVFVGRVCYLTSTGVPHSPPPPLTACACWSGMQLHFKHSMSVRPSQCQEQHEQLLHPVFFFLRACGSQKVEKCIGKPAPIYVAHYSRTPIYGK